MKETDLLYDPGAGRGAGTTGAANHALCDLGLGRSGRRCRLTGTCSDCPSCPSSARLRWLLSDCRGDSRSSPDNALSCANAALAGGDCRPGKAPEAAHSSFDNEVAGTSSFFKFIFIAAHDRNIACRARYDPDGRKQPDTIRASGARPFQPSKKAGRERNNERMSAHLFGRPHPLRCRLRPCAVHQDRPRL